MESKTDTDFDPVRKDCGLCGSTQISRWHEDYRGIQIFRCKNCEVQFMNPQYSSSYLKRYYADYLSHVGGEKPGMLQEQRYNLSIIEKYSNGKKGSFLDIGCGHGYLLKIAKEHGWRVAGYDLDEQIAHIASERVGVPIYHGDFSRIDWKEQQFNAISLCQVLEHVKEPRRYLEVVHSLLRNEGILFMSMPNIASISSKFKFYMERLGLRRRRVGAYYDTYHHLWYFTPKSARRFVESFGLRVLHMRSCRKFTTRGARFKRPLQLLTERFLGHSSFIVVCQKKREGEGVRRGSSLNWGHL